jgi:hypothetical protein
MKKATKKAVQKKQRNTYTLEAKAKAKKYYIIGLPLSDISKIVDAPIRTLEKWYIVENWKELRENKSIHSKALDLHTKGKTYKEIAILLNISTATVWRYITTAKTNKENGTN